MRLGIRTDSALQVGGGTVQGTRTGYGGTPRSVYVHRATAQLRWRDVQGDERAAQGVNLGPTLRSTGSLWVSNQGSLFFALDGAAFLVRPRPYESVSFTKDVQLSDGNIFGWSSQREYFGFTVPAGKRLLVTQLHVSMINYRYQGGPGLEWSLDGTAIRYTDGLNQNYARYGTVDAPLAVLPAGAVLGMLFEFNNITTNGLSMSLGGVLTDA